MFIVNLESVVIYVCIHSVKNIDKVTNIDTVSKIIMFTRNPFDLIVEYIYDKMIRLQWFIFC